MNEVFHRPKTRFVVDFVGATIFEGRVVKTEEGMSRINVDGFELVSLDHAETGENVKVAIRPENIVVFKSMPTDASAQNVIKAQLQEIMSEGNTCLLYLKVNDTVLHVFVANNAVERLNLKEDDTVYALIKACNVRIV